jgi:TRAP-type C4-dicarboxylate transport system permease small subunit
MERMIMVYEEKFKRIGTFIIFSPLIVMTVIECLNAIGRKLYIPFPCALEAVESLLVTSVYFGVSIVALEGGHVNVTIMTRKLPVWVQHFFDALANLFATLAFGYLMTGAWAEAIKAISILEMRIGVYRFPLWPFKTLYAVGMTFLTIQLVINLIKYIYLTAGRESYAGLKREVVEGELIMT